MNYSMEHFWLLENLSQIYAFNLHMNCAVLLNVFLY